MKTTMTVLMMAQKVAIMKSIHQIMTVLMMKIQVQVIVQIMTILKRRVMMLKILTVLVQRIRMMWQQARDQLQVSRLVWSSQHLWWW